LAKAAVSEAIIERQNDLTSKYDTLCELRTERSIEFENGKVIYYLVDEESKININTASEKVIMRLPGLSKGAAGEIVKMRGESNFKVADDILKISGIDEEDFYGEEDEPGLKDFITVYGGGAVNINTASYDILSVLIGEDDIVDRIFDCRGQEADTGESTEGNGIFSVKGDIITQLRNTSRGLSAKEALTMAQLIQNGSIAIKSEYYTIKISTEQKNRALVAFSVVCLPRDGSIKIWRED